jgi:Sporulation inhibitor A
VIELKGMAILSDKELWKAYNQAIEMKLEQEFIDLLHMELEKRKLEKGLDSILL